MDSFKNLTKSKISKYELNKGCGANLITSGSRQSHTTPLSDKLLKTLRPFSTTRES
jgi:hypothetical protein